MARLYVAGSGPLEGRWVVRSCEHCNAFSLVSVEAPGLSYDALVAALERARVDVMSDPFVPHEPSAADRHPCDLADHFGTPCSEPATPAKNGLVLCDRHEVERRGELCGITPQQWLRNIGHEDRIPVLFPERRFDE